MIVPAREFRRHATACRRIARTRDDDASKDAWTRLARRWDLCAELAEQETASACRLALREQGQIEVPRQAAAARR